MTKLESVAVVTEGAASHGRAGRYGGLAVGGRFLSLEEQDAEVRQLIEIGKEKGDLLSDVVGLRRSWSPIDPCANGLVGPTALAIQTFPSEPPGRPRARSCVPARSGREQRLPAAVAGARGA